MGDWEQINFRADAEVRAALDEVCAAYAATLQPGMRRDGIKSQMIRRAILELAARVRATTPPGARGAK
jgi:hypothetical protein